MVINKETCEKKKLSILFVEDNEDVRIAMTKGLNMVFETVYVVEDGEAALEVLKQHAIDFVLTDINMPRMDGISLIEEIRKTCHIMPIIITTAFEGFAKVYEGLPYIYLISKPYSIFDVVLIVDVMESQLKIERHVTHADDRAFEMLNDATREAKKLLDLIKRRIK